MALDGGLGISKLMNVFFTGTSSLQMAASPKATAELGVGIASGADISLILDPCTQKLLELSNDHT